MESDKAAQLAVQSEAVAEHFDAVFYAIRYPEAGGDPLKHFMTTGWREGKDPAPWFSMESYAATYPDVVEADLNPFYHYVCHGRDEGRSVTPAGTQLNDRAWEIEAVRQALDETFYARQLDERGITPSVRDLALHYWLEGASLGLDPSAEFSTEHYLQVHTDVAAAGVNPLAHFVEQGKREGRSARAARPEDQDHVQGHRGLIESGFDSSYYLAAYPDVAAAGANPLSHFIDNGWREGRNPNVWFSTADYLDSYPDIRDAGINPFLHYLLAGKSEGRASRHELGFRYDIIKSRVPLDRRIEHARKSSPHRKLARTSVLRQALAKARRLESRGLYVSISHDDFTENFGGVQLVLMRESASVDEHGLDHLHLFPATSLPVTELEVSDPILGVVLNQKRVGFFKSSEIASELKAASARISKPYFAIHSLIGHNADAVISILKSLACKSGWYWVHDYSSVCSSYTLLRNDVEFCGGPPASSNACSICLYGGLREAQQAAHRRLFDELDLTVLAPSKAALDVWKASFKSSAAARVHPHLRLEIRTTKKAARRTDGLDRPLRIAYVGLPVAHKGWAAFRELAMRFGGDPRYDFYHVGKQRQPGVPVKFEEVAVGSDDLNRMVTALRDLEIDVALFWSLWPETFCIAAVEALRAGAALLTFKDSGNVAALVRQTGFGLVLNGEEELTRLFETGEVADVAALRRSSTVSAEFSNMTADFIEARQ